MRKTQMEKIFSIKEQQLSALLSKAILPGPGLDGVTGAASSLTHKAITNGLNLKKAIVRAE